MKEIQEARRLIQSRLEELDAERGRLLDALKALPDEGAPRTESKARSNSHKPTRTRRSRGAGKRASRGQRQQQFLSDLSEHPGATMTEIARRMGVAPQQLYPIARRLESDGAIVKSE